jgi:hypothetical protein
MPCGVLPIAAPFLSASLASINLSTRASDLPTPTSPNVLQLLVFSEILIPINSDFAPAITIRVSDRRFAGPVFLGSTPVHLAEYLPWISADDRRLARKVRLERENMSGLRVFPHGRNLNPSQILLLPRQLSRVPLNSRSASVAKYTMLMTTTTMKMETMLCFHT